MSIIYGTLERLEAEQPPLAKTDQTAKRPIQDKRPAGSLLRTVTTALLFALAAANLVLWYWSHSNVNAVAVAPVPAIDSAPAVQTAPAAVPPTAPAPVHASVPAPIPATAPVTAPATTVVSDEPDATLSQTSTAETLAVAVGSSKKSSAAGDPPLTPSTEEPRTATARTNSPRVTAESGPGSQKSEAEPAPVVKPETGSTDRPSEHVVQRPVAKVQKQATSVETVQPVTIDTAVEEARLALSRGRYHGALAALQALQPIPENRADYWLIKGSAHLGAGQLELAEAALASARELAPSNAQIAVQMAILKQEMGDHESALQILGSVADRHPDVPEIFLNQGFSQQAMGAETAAKRSFRIFLRLTEGRSLYSRQRSAIEEWLSVES